MKINNAILIPPHTIHLCEPNIKTSFNFSVIHIDSVWFKKIFELDPGKLKPQISPINIDLINEKQNFFSIFESFNDKLEAESGAILFLGRLVFESFQADCLDKTKEKHHELIKVKSFIDKHFTEQIQLDDLKQISGQSKYGMLRKFKEQYKLTPHAYILNKRINHAKLLLQKPITVSRTAVECGFFDQSHFIKTFKNFVGVNPVDYQ